MDWARRVGAILVIIHAINPCFLLMHRVAADDFFSPLSPLLSPVIDAICDRVACGKGNCTALAGQTFGYACECDPGWSKIHVADNLRFLPCVIPNCSIDNSCFNNSVPLAPLASPAATNFSILEPCSWAYCGGGSCVKGSGLNYHCECKEGFSNLLNVTRLPCYTNCSLGADCANIGLPSANSSQSPPGTPSPSDSEKAAATGSISLNNLAQLLVLMLAIMSHAM